MGPREPQRSQSGNKHVLADVPCRPQLANYGLRGSIRRNTTAYKGDFWIPWGHGDSIFEVNKKVKVDTWSWGVFWAHLGACRGCLGSCLDCTGMSGFHVHYFPKHNRNIRHCAPQSSKNTRFGRPWGAYLGISVATVVDPCTNIGLRMCL